jgi:hypothetical protein
LRRGEKKQLAVGSVQLAVNSLPLIPSFIFSASPRLCGEIFIEQLSRLDGLAFDVGWFN